VIIHWHLSNTKPETSPPPVSLSPRWWDKLTQLTLFFPACGYQVGQFSVFLCQLEFAVIKAGLSGKTPLGYAPVGGQQRLPVHLKLLKLNKKTRKMSKQWSFFSCAAR